MIPIVTSDQPAADLPDAYGVRDGAGVVDMSVYRSPRGSARSGRRWPGARPSEMKLTPFAEGLNINSQTSICDEVK